MFQPFKLENYLSDHEQDVDGWLGHLLRKPNTAVAPLRHLLLLTALDVDQERFFSTTQPEQTAQVVLTPAGPWP